jgi:RNA polymerase sigma factor (sigma-70 family)
VCDLDGIPPSGREFPMSAELDPIDVLALQWRSEYPGEDIILSLFNSLVLPICKGNAQSDNAQEGFLALFEALTTWVPEKGPFSAYARTIIKRAIRRSWNSLRYPVSIPHYVAEAKARAAKGIEPEDDTTRSAVAFFSQRHGTLGEHDLSIPDSRELSVDAQEIGAELAEFLDAEIPDGSVLDRYRKGTPVDEIAQCEGVSPARIYQVLREELDFIGRAYARSF